MMKITRFIKITCSSCDTSQEVEKLVWEARRKTKAGLGFPCQTCKADLYKHGVRVRPGVTDNQRRSRKQEQRVAKREGGKRQPGSGAIDGFEGDVRALGRYRGECKFTRASSYTLKLVDLKKLESQARGEELPVFDLEFQSESPPKRYVVLPEWVFETLMEEAGRRNA